MQCLLILLLLREKANKQQRQQTHLDSLLCRASIINKYLMMMIQMMMKVLVLLLFFASDPTLTCAFTVAVVKPFQHQEQTKQQRYQYQHQIRNHHHHRQHAPLLLFSSKKTIGDDDGNEEQQQQQKQLLRSSYPDGTPAILRGEAVRSALKSGRCITWSFSSRSSSDSFDSESPFSNGGLLEIKGKGTINFLNNKLTQSFDYDSGEDKYKEAILLDPKGRIVDKLGVCVCCCTTSAAKKAYLVTSPGYSCQTLLNRLNPYIFPLDEVALTNYYDDDSDSDSFSFTIASTKIEHVQNVLKTQAFTNNKNQNQKSLLGGVLDFPKNNGEFKIWTLVDDDDDTQTKVLVIPYTGLPTIACVGYTLVFFSDNNNNNVGNDDNDDNERTASSSSSSSSSSSLLGNNIYQYLISEINSDGPIEIGELEYDTLRIEVGQPSYGYEYRISNKQQQKKKKDDKLSSSSRSNDNDDIKTSPLELYWGDNSKFIDYDKGCYLGQEGIASIMKNPRGPPRTLYSIIFEDEYNNYDNNNYYDDNNDNNNDSGDDKNDNLTTYPKIGQSLYALGSSEQINVGTITSIGEICGTGESSIVGLALIRRSDTILKQLKKYDIAIPTRSSENIIDITESSGLIQPPPLDPLDGLEVIIGGTYTVGKLRSIPSRRSSSSSSGGGGGLNNRNTNNMFDEEIIVDMPDISITTTPQPIPDDDDDETTSSSSGSIDEQSNNTNDDFASAAAAADKEAEEAAAMEAEAKRKAEKMELLRKRAEEAMARRKKKKKQQSKQE